MKIFTPILILFIIACSIQFYTACSNAVDEDVFDINFNTDYGEFYEIENTEETNYFKALKNNLFFYAFHFDTNNNYTFMHSASYYIQNSKEIFFIDKLVDDALEVNVKMEVGEPSAFHLYNPELAKTVTLTTKSFYAANYTFNGDSIIVNSKSIEKPTASDRKDPRYKKSIKQHNSQKTNHQLKLLKSKTKSISKAEISDYISKVLKQTNLDHSKFLMSGDTIFSKDLSMDIFNKSQYRLINDQNLLWKTVYDSEETSIVFDASENLLNSYRKVIGDHHNSFDSLTWTIENQYDSNGSLKSTNRYKNVDNKEKEFYDKTLFSYQLYASSKKFVKIEVFKSSGDKTKKLLNSIIFDSKLNWVEVTKKDGKALRKITYANQE